jgi:nucleotide-binding universal stress UspA family protein
MALRDLLCIVEATEKPSKIAVEQAQALARGHDALLSVIVVAPQVSPPYSFLGPTTVGGILQTENEKARKRAETLAADLKSTLAKTGVSGEVELGLDAFPNLLRTIKRHSFCNDLTVVDRPGGVLDHSELIFEEVLFEAAYPVMVAVPDREPVENVEKIAFAWDGSIHAVRALAATLGLFDVKEADVIVVKGEKDLSASVPGARVAAHLERHGAKAKVVEVSAEKSGVAATIDEHAAKAKADLIVLGGFGRSRLREFILGGVTRELSRRARTPLLLAH